jgi:hypothetical protein
MTHQKTFSCHVLFILGLIAFISLTAPALADKPVLNDKNDWITKSNHFTQRLLTIDYKYFPEEASREGLSRYDRLISSPTIESDLARRSEMIKTIAIIDKQASKINDKNIQKDIHILDQAIDLDIRSHDYALAHDVPFLNASRIIFSSFRSLLNDQVDKKRHAAAIDRLKKYAGLEKGYQPYATLLKNRTSEQMSKGTMSYPWREEIETELSRNSHYIEGIETLFKNYHLKGWEKSWAVLKSQLIDYDSWVRQTLYPQARQDFRLAPESYALRLEENGVDIAPNDLTILAHEAFRQIQTEMIALAPLVAAEKGYQETDYRAVIKKLKKEQILGEDILPFFKNRLHEIETIIHDHALVSLPNRPAIIRLASAAETAEQPAPHMIPPAILHNNGERGEFVLPLNISSTEGEALAYDDDTSDAASWDIIAHEARPGHELQFDSMIEHGVSLARALYAENGVNVEGWALYAEYLIEPYEPKAAQLFTLQWRLQRAARAFLDPELQAGLISPEEALQFIENEVVLSHAMAKQEVERYTYRSPGQATCYFYGFKQLLALRKMTEDSLGSLFNQRNFHDFILAQGILPLSLIKKSVLEDFIPQQKNVATKS